MLANAAFKTAQILSAISFKGSTSDQPTPWELALNMVDEIPSDCFNTGVLIPGSGFGVFALALIYRGWDPVKITCVEIDPRFVLITQKWVGRFGVRILQKDFLIYSKNNMQFEVVIGNPPYQDSNNAATNNKLWMKFVTKALDLCAEGGFISFITPDTIVGPTLQPAKNRKRLSSDFSLESLDYRADDFFGVSVNICRWTARNKPYSGSTRVIENGTERVIDLRKELPLKIEAVAVNSLAEKIAAIIKLNTTLKLDGHFDSPLGIEDGDIPVYWSGPNKIRKINQKLSNDGQLKVVVSYSASPQKWFVTSSAVSGWNKLYPVASIEEGLEIGSTLSHPVIRFFMDHWRKTAGFTPAIRQKDMMPDIRGMTDDEINALFELTAEEIAMVYINRKPAKDELRVRSLTD